MWMNSTVAASSKRSRPAKPSASGEKKHEHRPDALAASADDVVRDLVDQRDLRRQPRWITASTCRISSAMEKPVAGVGEEGSEVVSGVGTAVGVKRAIIETGFAARARDPRALSACLAFRSGAELGRPGVVV